MDKEYILFMIRERIKELKADYRKYVVCNGTYGGSAVMRSRIKQQLSTCVLIEELLNATVKVVELSDEAQYAIDRLVEPCMRKKDKELC